jgi:transmembrane sensor
MGNEYHDIDWQAARWIDRMSRPLQDAELAAEFDRWILKDPRHVEAYARFSAIWQSDGFDTALQDDGAVPAACNDDERPPWPSAAWRRVGAACSVMLGIVFALLVATVLWRSMKVKTVRTIPVQAADEGAFPVPPLPKETTNA